MQVLYQHNHDNYMLMIACSGMAFGIGLRAAIMARGRRSLWVPEGANLLIGS